MPSNQNIVKCKWVIKMKCSGMYDARLVACGYSQIPRVDFTENYLPAINDIMYWILLLIMIHNAFSAEVVHIEKPSSKEN